MYTILGYDGELSEAKRIGIYKTINRIPTYIQVTVSQPIFFKPSKYLLC